jgi:hypothetical protein
MLKNEAKMTTRLLLALLGLFHVATGLWMLADPMGWYLAVPGVTSTGPMNHHFIVDIGLAFIASGAGMIASLSAARAAAGFALAGSTWPALHGLFHVWEWIADGIPTDMRVLISTAVGVMVVSFAGFALAWMRAWRSATAMTRHICTNSWTPPCQRFAAS